MRLTLSWLAGFFDGEGCIHLFAARHSRKTGRPILYPRICVTNTHLPTLKAIQATFGGTLSARKKSSKKPNWRQAYALIWTNKKALALLSDMLPFLVLKHSQAELVLTGYHVGTQGKRLSDEEITQRVQLQSQISDMKRIEYVQ